MPPGTYTKLRGVSQVAVAAVLAALAVVAVLVLTLVAPRIYQPLRAGLVSSVSRGGYTCYNIAVYLPKDGYYSFATDTGRVFPSAYDYKAGWHTIVYCTNTTIAYINITVEGPAKALLAIKTS